MIRGAVVAGLHSAVGGMRWCGIGRYGGQAAVSDFARGLGMTLDQVEAELS